MGGVLKAQSEPPDFPQAQPSPLFPSICIAFSIVSSGLTLHRNIPGSGFLLPARKMEHTPHAQNLPVLQDN